MNRKNISIFIITIILLHVLIEASAVLFVLTTKVKKPSDIDFFNPRYLDVYNMLAKDLGLLGLCLILRHWGNAKFAFSRKNQFFFVAFLSGVWLVFSALHLVHQVQSLNKYDMWHHIYAWGNLSEIISAVFFSMSVLYCAVKMHQNKFVNNNAIPHVLRASGALSLIYGSSLILQSVWFCKILKQSVFLDIAMVFNYVLLIILLIWLALFLFSVSRRAITL